MMNNSKIANRILKRQVVREAVLYETIGDSKVRCKLCERRCVIASGTRGFCKTRMNIGGRLFTLVYGNLSAIESRPIEIKPFYHYWPGSTALTFSTWSCNFTCPWCQNYHLSRRVPEPEIDSFTSPSHIIDLATLRGDDGVCASFQEPTLLTDWAIDTFSMARAHGLYSCYVSNGYITLEALELLRNAGMSAIKIDVKGDMEVYDKYCGCASDKFVWRNISHATNSGLHVEVVNLLVTGVNDDECSIRNVVDNHLKYAGTTIPLHFNRYFPAYKYDKPPTDLGVMKIAYQLAKSAGVEYVYLGNIPDANYQNTYCPNCNSVLIKRSSLGIIRKNISRDHHCLNCGKKIPIVGRIID